MAVFREVDAVIMPGCGAGGFCLAGQRAPAYFFFL
jgi:hypothetical protein